MGAGEPPLIITVIRNPTTETIAIKQRAAAKLSGEGIFSVAEVDCGANFLPIFRLAKIFGKKLAHHN